MKSASSSQPGETRNSWSSPNPTSMLIPAVYGFVLGSVAVYFADPDNGRRRRALLRDQIRSRRLIWMRQGDRWARDWSHRLRGLRSQWIRVSQSEVDDETLVQRVRSEFGRVIRHPRAIRVSAERGVVTLSGTILMSEVKSLIACVSRVRGLKKVINHLDVKESSEHVSALQGDGPSYLQ